MHLHPPPPRKFRELSRNPSSIEKNTAVFIRQQKLHYDKSMQRSTLEQCAAIQAPSLTEFGFGHLERPVALFLGQPVQP